MSDADPLGQLVAPPIFVVGHHRSGTTWVFDLLTHPDEVAGVFESWLFTPKHGLGGLLHWGHWDPEHVEQRERIFGQRAGLGQMASREEVRDVCRDLAGRWLSRVLEPHHRFLVEKSPDHLYAALAISEVFPDARFVNVVRDGRDVAVSLKAARSWAPGELSQRLASVQHIARRWRYAMTVSKNLADLVGDRYLEVRYEDLIAHPHRVLAELFAFCGISADEATVSRCVDAADFAKHRETGNDHFRRKGRVGDWHGEFNILDRMFFQRGAGSTLRASRYEASRWWWIKGKRSGDTRPM